MISLKVLLLDKKSFVLSSLIIFISLLSLIFLFNLYLSSKNIINEEINNKFINRDYIVKLNDDINVFNELEKVSNFDSVEYSYPNYPSLILESTELGSVNLQGAMNESIDKLVYVEEYLNDNYIILPSCLGSEDLIGKEILLSSSTQDNLKFIVAGIYYLEEDNISDRAYTSISYYISLVKNIYEVSNELHIILKKSNSLNNLLDKISSDYTDIYLNDSSGLTEKNMYEGMENLLFNFIIGILIFLLVTFLLTINITLNHEYESIAILKALGYPDSKIYTLLLILFFITISTIYLLSYILTLILIFIIKLIFKHKIFKVIHFGIKDFFLVYLIIILILFLTLLFSNFKIKRISIIKLMNENG